METLLIKTVTPLVLPPGINLLCMLAGFALLRWRPRTARWLVGLGFVSLYLLSTQTGVDALRGWLEVHPALAPEEVRAREPQAVVVLGGGRYPVAPEFGAETVSEFTLSRLRYGTFLARTLDLPVLVTGGSVYGESVSEGELMRRAARDAFAVEVRWVESASINTAENARLSAALLAADGVHRIALVTHSTHMRRAVKAFRAQGLEVIPAPTQVDTSGDGTYGWLDGALPTAGHLHHAQAALHEFAGILWYALRY